MDAATLKEAAVILQLVIFFDGDQFCVSKCMRRASIDEKTTSMIEAAATTTMIRIVGMITVMTIETAPLYHL